MSQINYQGRAVAVRDGENVLDALLRQGINIPFSCRNGVCHVCMQQCTHGSVPVASQHGLRQELVEQNCFLACQCIPNSDMEIEPPSGLFETTLVAGKALLSTYVVKILLEPPSNFKYQAGQFINVRRKDGVVRSYSLSSLPEVDYFLEIHVQRKQGGTLSNWFFDELETGAELDISGPFGECYYREEFRVQPLLLVATGTGLSPLFGILREALRKRHQGNIHLYHGGRAQDRFYLRDTLRQYEQAHANFKYFECISGDAAVVQDVLTGRVHDAAFARHDDLNGWQVFLAGLAEMVESAGILAFKNGAVQECIHADPFALRDLRSKVRESEKAKRDTFNDQEVTVDSESGKYPPADPELWAALHNGELLMAVLQDFYGKVFQDPKLSGFFVGVTRQRSIEKQFLFMRQILTGEKIYFGDRPRNAHHWMVISNELFDYRADIMMSSLRKHGLSEEMVQRFHNMEEFYRGDIVKPAPFPRTMGGVELPLDGFEELIMEVGTLCDSCEREISVGEKVKYHVRIGKVYCTDCSSQHIHEDALYSAGT